jgi:hypothetical protein
MYSMFVSLNVKYELSQSIHMPSRFDCSVWTAEKRATKSRQRRANSSSPYSSISRFESRPSCFSTCTSTCSPCESKPFW